MLKKKYFVVTKFKNMKDYAPIFSDIAVIISDSERENNFLNAITPSLSTTAPKITDKMPWIKNKNMNNTIK